MRKLRVKLMRFAFAGMVVLALFSGAAADTSVMTDFAFRWSGYLLLVAGLGLRMWSIVYIGGKKTQELITTGPYSLCRNPLYVGTILLTLGFALSFDNLLMCLWALVVVIPVHVITVLMEERHLGAIFRERYAQYYRQTPRFFFRFSSYRGVAHMDLSVQVLQRAAFDALGILMIPPLANLIGVLHSRGMLPVFWGW